jgi:pimeloyl-ACP methyl ester carboxylesterase
MSNQPGSSLSAGRPFVSGLFSGRLGFVVALLLPLVAGCATQDPGLLSDVRMNQGYTIILPGILGHSYWDNNTVRGLVAAQVPSAIEVYDWTLGPHMMPANVLYEPRRKRQIQKIAAKIVDYQNRYPGRPVHLIGHSGGANMVVSTLESLPPDRRVTVALLLSAPLSCDYDLRKAQRHTERGVHNFHSPYDVLIGQGIGSVAAVKNGSNPLTAGFVGFSMPSKLTPDERGLYDELLAEHGFSWEMAASGHFGGHFGWTTPDFVGEQIAPILLEEEGGPSIVLTAAQ